MLRRARAARRGYTRFLAGAIDIAPADFCAIVTTWEPGGFARELAEYRRVVRLLLRALPAGAVWDALVATRRLGRHGATPAQRDAFAGAVRWPAVREPADDPVVELLGDALLPERASLAQAG